MNKIIYYYQTFTGLEPVLKQKPQMVTDIIVCSIHFGLDVNRNPYIHLNDLVPDNKTFDKMWEEVETAHNMGMNIHIMLGGAGGAFEDLFNNFETYYKMLLELINSKKFINGINLDVEEPVGLDNIIKLIKRLDQDLDKDFKITMAPVSFALVSNSQGMGGFRYKDLKQSEVGNRISQYNGQFYGDFTFETYDSAIKNGYSPEEVVIGMLGSEYNSSNIVNACNELKKIMNKYPNFCGVFVWEYCQAPPDKVKHEKWAELMYKTMRSVKRHQQFLKVMNSIKDFFEKIGEKIKKLFI